MQHYEPQVLFCSECGLANEPEARQCASCQHPLDPVRSVTNILSPALVTVTPPPVHEVMAGSQSTDGVSAHYLACDFRPGSILAGRYQIEGEIGRGGFSIVYRAVDRYRNFERRPVAIKRIQLDQLTPRQIIDATETFNREVATLSRFGQTPGIPAYYAHLTDSENWYLITQYIEGQTLEEYLQKAPGGYLKEQEVVELGMVLADVFHLLHVCNPPIIFRDLKPANIMCTPQRTFFVIDFGIARLYTPGKMKDTTPLGSPGYAPPEQYGRAQTDWRSDVYSLGATLQTLLTGRDPLELRAGESSRNRRAPTRALRKLLDEMLSPEPAKRPATMMEVKKRLEHVRKRAVARFMVGFVSGITGYSFTWLPPLIPVNSPLKDFSFLISMTVAFGIFILLLKILGFPIRRRKEPKEFTRFWSYGFFTSMVLSLIIIPLIHGIISSIWH